MSFSAVAWSTEAKSNVRQIDLDHTEIRFTINAELKAKLQEVRSLMGPRGGSLTLAELVAEMASISARHFAEKKFGKKRVRGETSAAGLELDRAQGPRAERRRSIHSTQFNARPANGGMDVQTSVTPSTSNVESATASSQLAQSLYCESKPFSNSTSNVESRTSQPQLEAARIGNRAHYIPQSVKHAVWRAAGGRCACCSSQNNLQFDHVRAVALGGTSTPDNLQLLCGSCNLRRGVKTFGTGAMKRG
jgi:5-methylcytosine-specific restriction endonuclease McrA